MPSHDHAVLQLTQHRSYLSGNFSPIQQTLPLTPCSHQGTIPDELAGGEYVRNGGNPVSNNDLGRDAHWFDGDGMLSGVSFRREKDGQIHPEFVNQYILTDVYLSSTSSGNLKRPVLPSITTLVNPLGSLFGVTLHIMRTIILVLLSFLPGSRKAIKKISVANTAILYHDGRALATCESGPPMRISLPSLETVGWYNGNIAEGEPLDQGAKPSAVLGGEGLLSWMREWTTGHPKVDPVTKEMLLFHATFLRPYIRYSVIPSSPVSPKETLQATGFTKLINEPVPGISGPKMMHDFGASLAHTVIMDLPLSLDPLNLAKGKPVIEYDNTKPSRFAVFPRYRPDQVRYFETSACCIFHTANTWDEIGSTGATRAVHMLACRLISSTLVYAAGNIVAPVPIKRGISHAKKRGISWFDKYHADDTRQHTHVPCTEETKLLDVKYSFEENLDLESPRVTHEPLIRIRSNGEIDEIASSPPGYFDDVGELVPDEEEQCRLYHYAFDLATSEITSQYALSAIPFEFPSVHPQKEMQAARYIYGCSTTVTSFGAALGKATKINVLVKIDSQSLIERGELMVQRGQLQPITGCVDTRSITEILMSNDAQDPVKIFRCPEHWFVQEPRFVPRSQAISEDDGFLLTYAFNENQLERDGGVPSDDDPVRRAKSELWIIDARDMKTIVARIELPQRVPYGLHGGWFSEEQIQHQQPVESVRLAKLDCPSSNAAWMGIRNRVEKILS